MYLELVEWAWRTELPASNWKFILVALATHADCEGRFYGGIKRIEHLTGLYEETVTNALINLGAKGLLIPDIGCLILLMEDSKSKALKTPQIIS